MECCAFECGFQNCTQTTAKEISQSSGGSARFLFSVRVCCCVFCVRDLNDHTHHGEKTPLFCVLVLNFVARRCEQNKSSKMSRMRRQTGTAGWGHGHVSGTAWTRHFEIWEFRFLGPNWWWFSSTLNETSQNSHQKPSLLSAAETPTCSDQTMQGRWPLQPNET